MAKDIGKNKPDPLENAKISAAAVGGAVVGAAGAVLASKVLNDPKNRKKLKQAFEGAKDQMLDTLGTIQERAQDTLAEGKKTASKTLKRIK